ncbi:MAG: nickel-dependent hydrogenase large subunit [Deltaproteobacteria bacterium]|nr:nickel-dependent hydrogenase large subunit [Deltaproteobacteria bacterium]
MANVTIPVGPQHPALKEPECFKVTLDGEKIVGVEIRLGYNHRGIEKACEERTIVQSQYILERVCGICSHSHSTCFLMAVEEAGKIEVPRRALWIRTLIGELERIHSHLLWLGVAGHELGFDTLLMYTWRDRELVMDLLALISGNRVNYNMNVLGGARRDITDAHRAEIRKALPVFRERTAYYARVAQEESTLIARLSGVGRLTKEEAIFYNANGPTARGSGVDRDTRRDDPYLAFPELEFEVVLDDHSDVYGRTLVRIGELMQTYDLIEQIIDGLPEGPIGPARAIRRVAAGEAVSRYEAPRGEDIHYVCTNGTDKVERVKVRAPTLGNLPAVVRMLEGGFLADVPIVVAAIDPCFSCTDRGIRVARSQGQDVWDADALRAYAIEFYRKRGLDLTRVKAPGR